MEDRVIFISYDETARKILWNTTGIIAGWDTFTTWDIELLSQGNYQYYLLPHDILPEHIVRDTEALGKRFVTYTVNTTGTLTKLYNQWVRMVMTDNIPLLKNRAEKNLGK
jgi:glycerophosphoryl diester phosphodiesterase